MAAITRKLGPKSGDNIRMEIDLRELFGDDVANRPAARQALAQDVIDAIVEKAKDFGGKYSAAYADSLEFKAFGKSRGDVDLTLTGSMLSELDLLADTKNKLVIGWDPGSEDGKKAHGNITGQNGRVKIRRDFFKLSETEIQAIADKHRDSLESAPAEERLTVQEVLDAINRGERFF